MVEFENKTTIIDKVIGDGVEFEIIQTNELGGATNPAMAMSLYFAQKAGLSLRQVKIKLKNGSIKTEAGALYYYKGNISVETKIGGVGGILKKAISSHLTSESLMKPIYTGTGEIVLEPSFKHYLLLELNNESVVVDKSMFYASTSDIEIKAVAQKNVSSAFFGNEGIFQISLSGKGIVVLECNVPFNEIEKYYLRQGEELKVDGNFAILRSANVEFSVTKSDKTLIASAMNGEGLLNTFKAKNGEGYVWLAPTEPIYNKLAIGLPIDNKGSNNTQ